MRRTTSASLAEVTRAANTALMEADNIYLLGFVLFDAQGRRVEERTLWSLTNCTCVASCFIERHEDAWLSDARRLSESVFHRGRLNNDRRRVLSLLLHLDQLIVQLLTLNLELLAPLRLELEAPRQFLLIIHELSLFRF